MRRSEFKCRVVRRDPQGNRINPRFKRRRQKRFLKRHGLARLELREIHMRQRSAHVVLAFRIVEGEVYRPLLRNLRVRVVGKRQLHMHVAFRRHLERNDNAIEYYARRAVFPRGCGCRRITARNRNFTGSLRLALRTPNGKPRSLDSWSNQHQPTRNRN